MSQSRARSVPSQGRQPRVQAVVSVRAESGGSSP